MEWYNFVGVMEDGEGKPVKVDITLEEYVDFTRGVSNYYEIVVTLKKELEQDK